MYIFKGWISSIKKARESAGFTQKEVESHLNLRPLTMRDYEVGRLKLPMSVALQLANLYQVSLDQLVGHSELKPQTPAPKILANFTAIFEGDSYNVMFLDPILRAHLEDHRDDFLDSSLFEVITLDLTEKQKKEFILILGRLFISLAGCDGKVSENESKTIKYIFSVFRLESHYKEVTQFVGKSFSFKSVPSSLKSIVRRHFLIWTLFLFAKTDSRITTDELKFIEARAEELKINRTNFLTIRQMLLGD
ncbi:MAG: helix-turn-helix transcriptional regulator [Bdellovibrionales bacterium]|nr:helix-turn-helix transcriptional regulator [Bdellovibrionales bacterium]